MLHPVPEAELIEDLYKYAWLLVPRVDLAQKVVLDAWEEIFSSGSALHDDSERIHAKLFQAIRLRALKVPPFEESSAPEQTTGAGWPPHAARVLKLAPSEALHEAIRRIEEPARSAYILLTLDLVEVESVERILGVNMSQLADLMDRARFSIASTLKGSIQDS